MAVIYRTLFLSLMAAMGIQPPPRRLELQRQLDGRTVSLDDQRPPALVTWRQASAQLMPAELTRVDSAASRWTNWSVCTTTVRTDTRDAP